MAAMLIVVMGHAVRQMRERRRRGLRMDWAKLAATAGGAIAVALAAMGAILGGMMSNRPALGAILSALIMVGGLVTLILWLRWRWPDDEAPR